MVATEVGGVPEVLPPEMIVLCPPSSEQIVVALEQAMAMLPVDAKHNHWRIAEMYSWDDVAERTEHVYDQISEMPRLPFIERLKRYYGCGAWAGKLFSMVVALDFLVWQFICWWRPAREIDTGTAYKHMNRPSPLSLLSPSLSLSLSAVNSLQMYKSSLPLILKSSLITFKQR